MRTILNLEHFRRNAGVSLEQISDHTKISARFLRAIENEEFLKLPGGVFNTSYIRQYAQSVGYPEHDLLQHYQARMRELAPAEFESQTPATEPKASSWRTWLNWLRTPSSSPLQERS